MAIKEAKGEIIFLGNFNAYHPIWGGRHIASEKQVEYLLAEINARGLILATLKGESIWKRRQQESVIDLMFISPNLYRKVNFYGIIKEWALTKDYIPICIQINNTSCLLAECQYFAFKKLDL